ncbi:MAG: nitroreductase family deazaflavin-dependent oxidoreductase [Sphingomonadaceae bacterium]|nr:nitroreductase family deazaflavin-dependent oxidoreductase [Sphingomonadaceae bacterium]
MSDESSIKASGSARDWQAEHKRTYLESGGREGHIIDMSSVGGLAFTTTLLLKYVGRKTGKTMISPLIYGNFGGEVVIVASKGGAPAHPGWYLNIRDAGGADFQIGGQAFRGAFREAAGEERAKVWAFMAGLYPPYDEYQAKTDRHIPVVMLAPGAEIDIFHE